MSLLLHILTWPHCSITVYFNEKVPVLLQSWCEWTISLIHTVLDTTILSHVNLILFITENNEWDPTKCDFYDSLADIVFMWGNCFFIKLFAREKLILLHWDVLTLTDNKDLRPVAWWYHASMLHYPSVVVASCVAVTVVQEKLVIGNHMRQEVQ